MANSEYCTCTWLARPYQLAVHFLVHPDIQKKCSVPSLDKPLCKMHMHVIPLAALYMNIRKITQVIRHRSSSTCLLLLVWSVDVTIFCQHGMATRTQITAHAHSLEDAIHHQYIFWITLTSKKNVLCQVWTSHYVNCTCM
jgi:hypothetical protein